ncbi:MAG: RagB/SusD family nutrient uptake outer membrane protein [Sediminicola sp.]
MKKLWMSIIGTALLQYACEDFVEVDVPDNKIVSETVFSSDELANSAVTGIFNELFNRDLYNGDFRSATMLGDLSADNLMTTDPNEQLVDFEQNQVLVGNSYNLELWSSAYNVVYMCNAVIEGLRDNEGVSVELEEKLLGEVLFVRAFTYFHLVNLYGEVPLIRTSDYRENDLAPRTATTEIYDAVMEDLESAANLLGAEYEGGERTRPTKFTAMALLARVHLFLEEWEEAEILSTQLIGNNGMFSLLNDLGEVFLANSHEAIWQISPLAGGALSPVTHEARVFIINAPPPISQKPVALSSDLIGTYSPRDLRREHWIEVFQTESNAYYFPLKYRTATTDGNVEHSMAMRFAEQYLIRAEARAHQGKLPGAIEDLDKIRERANLEPIWNVAPSIGMEALLDSIQLERRRELFTEWGHRWLDLKRTGRVSEVLGTIKPSWQDTDALYPIPEEEINKNPNLSQNLGY